MQKSFIIIKGQPRGLQIVDIKLVNNGTYAIRFTSKETVYHYAQRDVVVLTEKKYYDPSACQVYINGIHKRNIAELLAFPQGNNTTHWRITYDNGSMRDFLNGKDIEIKENCLASEKAKLVFEYFKATAEVNQLGKDNESLGILTTQYNNISFIDEKLAIGPYIYPDKLKIGKMRPKEFIYPFGCNASQKKAVTEAFTNQLSVIQGPPGTGKTQTILNIIANIVMQGKTALVVSNNNSATANVHEKLKKYGIDFIVAPLGKRDNKELFIQNQPTIPTSLSSWECGLSKRVQTQHIVNQTLSQLDTIFRQQEELAQLKLELQSLKLEWEHFKSEQNIEVGTSNTVSSKSASLMSLWLDCQAMVDNDSKRSIGIFGKLIENLKWRWTSLRIKLLLHASNIDKHNLWPIIIELQKHYYQTRLVEVKRKIEDLENSLNEIDAMGLFQLLTENSMVIFKNELCNKYKKAQPLVMLETKEIQQRAEEFCKRYPVVLSTTFSAKTSVPDYVFDYVIMDEASQVSVETGALTLTCAKNAVIVGDTLQLPNVVTEEDRVKLNNIYDRYKVAKDYNSADNSFLESICKVVPNVKQTLLREHYRCHPRIINFCNQKYYGGNLLIMTEDHNETDVLSAIKTVPGHHARGHYNQREIDVIKEEVLPNIPQGTDIGIISPYNVQVDAINAQLGEIAATVHKYQGREKDSIIFSVVDDEITEFSDDPNLLNVAISRAKKNFTLVVTGNQQEKNGNITDLVDYIEYNNCSVTESKVHSIFDYLYTAYTNQRMKLLAESERISEYDSENLTYVYLVIYSHKRFKSSSLI